jgi:hypothetical protein
VGPPKTKPPEGGFVFGGLFLRLFVEDALPKRGVELGELYLALDLLFILPRPHNVLGLRGLELQQAIL